MSKRAWYVVYTKPHKEDTAEFHCLQKAITSFYPKLLLPSSATRGDRVIPLFPNYLFVRLRFPEEYHRVIWLPGIRYLITAEDVPLPVEEKFIDYLKRKANAEGLIMARSNLKVGERVQVGAGPFEGLEAVIQDPPDARSRVRVLMNLLNRQVPVVVPLRFVNHGWVVAGGNSVQRTESSSNGS
jgi:transcriptional antiterminator RfaH